MVLQLAEVYFHDVNSRKNKDLTDFFRSNIRNIIMKAQIRFRFKIAKTRELADLKKNRGVPRLPAMLIRGRRPIIGVNDIVEALLHTAKSSRTTAPAKSEEEVLDEYYRMTLGEMKKDDDGKFNIREMDQEEETDTIDLGALTFREIEKRKGGGAFGGEDDGNDNYNRTNTRPVPRQPDRTALQDYDYEDDEDDNRQRRRPRVEPRQNNLNVEPGDPVATLDNMRYQGGGMEDDQMMRQLLAKMGDGGGMP